jgi:hypothetical protein
MPKIRLLIPTGTSQVARFYKPLFKDAEKTQFDGFSKTEYDDVPLMVLENAIAGFENLVVFASTAVYATDSEGKTLDDKPIGRLLSLEISDELHTEIMQEAASHLVKKFKSAK